MSNFWDLNDGTEIEVATSYESSGGDIPPMPDNTQTISAIEEAKWDEYAGDRYISLKWRVMQPEIFSNRVVFHKVKVFGLAADKDPQATADKAKKMLAAIDSNAGGKLMQVKGEPTDTDLMSALGGKLMATKLKLWRIENKETGAVKEGNWVCAVSPAKGATVSNAPAPAPAAKADDFDDDIPF